MSGLNEKLTKLLRLAVGSDSEGEQLTALRRVLRILVAEGKTAADLQVFTLVVEETKTVQTPHYGTPPRPRPEPEESNWEPPWRKFAKYGAGHRPQPTPAEVQRAHAAQEALLRAQRVRAEAMKQKSPFCNPFVETPVHVDVESEEVEPDEFEECERAGIPRTVYDAVAEIRLPFGKHIGMTPLGVVVKDRKYATWAVENFKDDRWIKLFRAALIRRKHHPLEHVDTGVE